MDQIVRREGVEVQTTRCPIRIDNQILLSPKAAPRVGEDTQRIQEELDHA
jgi:crotonobetainyl-CoA:carnitine CoA-transferase CaiB-like acyl-CoA transferase